MASTGGINSTSGADLVGALLTSTSGINSTSGADLASGLDTSMSGINSTIGPRTLTFTRSLSGLDIVFPHCRDSRHSKLQLACSEPDIAL